MSRTHLADNSDVDGDTESTEAVDDEPVVPAPELPPLWYRIITGRSFGWRLRSFRRRRAGRALRWLKRHPEIRQAAYSGSMLRLLAAGLWDRRKRVSARRRWVYRPDIHLANHVVVMPPSGVLVDDVALDATTGPPVSVTYNPNRTLLDVIGPSGRVDGALTPVDLAQWNPSTFQQRPPGGPIGIAEVLDERHHHRTRLARAQRAWSVDCGIDADRPPVVVARMIAQLAAAGVAVVGRPGEQIVELIGTSVSEAICDRADQAFTDDRERELYSLRLRRVAFERHSPRGWWSSIGGRIGADVDAVPAISVLLPSNRPEDVVGAARLVARQVGVRTQLVVGLHGAHMPGRLDDELRAAFAGDLVIRRCPDEWNLGQVLNELTAAADGKLVSKWDDDDWYEPQHLADLVRALEFSGASLVGKAAEFVYLEGLDLTLRRFATGAERWNTTIAGGTLIMTRSELDEVGWADVPSQVDRHLIDALQARGRAVYRTHGFGYVLRRSSPATASHTWEAGDDYFLRQATDQRSGLDLGFAGFDGAGLEVTT